MKLRDRLRTFGGVVAVFAGACHPTDVRTSRQDIDNLGAGAGAGNSAGDAHTGGATAVSDAGGAGTTPAVIPLPSCKAPEFIELDVELIAQESKNLCWAASAQIMARSVNVPHTQCQQVRGVTPSCGCSACNASANLATGPCNHGGWPDFHLFGYRADKTEDGVALTIPQLVDELGCHQRPVVFSWHTGPKSGHMMVAYGYHDNGKQVDVVDPLSPCVGAKVEMPYDNFRNGFAPGTSHHWSDFSGFRKE